MRFAPGTAADERRSLNAAQGATEKQRLLVPRAYLLRLAKGRDVPAAARAYERNPNVEFAQPNYIAEPVSTTPNDSSFSSLWGLHNTGQTVNGVAGTPDADVDAPEAWDVTQGSTAVTVGIADTGHRIRPSRPGGQHLGEPGRVRAPGRRRTASTTTATGESTTFAATTSSPVTTTRWTTTATGPTWQARSEPSATTAPASRE